MSVQMTASAPVAAATTAECAVVTELMTETEAPISGAPVYSPPTALLLAVILSPKEPKRPRK